MNRDPCSSPQVIPEASLEKTPPFQASKWISIALLCEENELLNLFGVLDEPTMVSIAGVNENGKEITSLEQFFSDYKKYIQALKEGQMPPHAFLQEAFTKALSLDVKDFRKIPVGDSRNLVRIVKPVIQMQPYSFTYSETDGRFHEKVYSLDSIPWGVQFSYPQIYQDPVTKEVKKVFGDPEFANTPLFKKLQHWIRENTTPTPFLIGEKKINVPMRIGKIPLPWLNNHPSLLKKMLKVCAHG
jgi:hypothetical protein